MKIDKIECIKGVYKVYLSPNWFEKLFGVQYKVEWLKPTRDQYVNNSGNNVYLKPDGTRTHNGCFMSIAIDKMRNSFNIEDYAI